TRTSFRGFLMLLRARVLKLGCGVALAFLSMVIVQSIPAQFHRARPSLPPPGNNIPPAVTNNGSHFGNAGGGMSGQQGVLGGNNGALGGNVGGFAGNTGGSLGNFGTNGSFGQSGQ